VVLTVVADIFTTALVLSPLVPPGVDLAGEQ
jgi:hypothetical protein